jgi:hypothetical protein
LFFFGREGGGSLKEKAEKLVFPFHVFVVTAKQTSQRRERERDRRKRVEEKETLFLAIYSE